ncbi:MAG: hypothetical protein EOM85_00675 [Candidatus Moranbacteria bacterium]|nr:hypothetical protein [Candidatus Moranbacteria bacterium]
MPNLDGTGPMGQGPRTGRGMGRGCGFCRGCRYGRGFRFSRFFCPKNKPLSLGEQEKLLVEELNAVREEKESLSNEDK